MQSRMILGAGVLLSAALLVGCDNTREGMERDAENAAAESERAAEQTAEAAREAGRDTRDALGNAADETREAAGSVADAAREGTAEMRQEAREAASVGDAAQQTAQIKTALMADASIDSTSIDVDTNADTKTVTLRGRVRTAAEKTKAASIAADKAPGYRVTNNLEVGR